jgi:electron transfer flavoprotein beta subunit
LTSLDLGVDEQPALILRRLYIRPPAETRAELITAETARAAGGALAERLHQEGMI